MKRSSQAAIEPPQDIAAYILPGERIINIEYIISPPLASTPSALDELYRLARAKVKNKLYEFNPPLASLALETDRVLSPELHRYETLFARDSLRVAIDMIPLFPQLTRTTLMTLASFQGTTTHHGSEEEPGRIPHEMRDASDPVARRLSTGLGWEWPYYGSVDATPEFIRTLFTYQSRLPKNDNFLQQKFTDKDGIVRTIADAFNKAVDWLLYRTNSNPEGLLESKTSLSLGIENQTWKDSWDAYFHSDGRIANHTQGVASIEVQRLAYDALLDAAHLYDKVLHQPDKARIVRAKAKQIRQAIFTYFWTPDHGGYFVLGTDRDDSGKLRQLAIRTSNMGHLLHSRLLVGKSPRIIAFREAIIRQLFSPEMLTPSGIRTLASNEIRFRPGAYHNGSIWLWDTHFIAKGLRRHGYYHLGNLLSERLLGIVDATHAFPEFVRGDNTPQPTLNNRVVDVWDSTYGRANRIEQPPQQVQAWSVAAILALEHYNKTSSPIDKQIPLAVEQEILRRLH